MEHQSLHVEDRFLHLSLCYRLAKLSDDAWNVSAEFFDQVEDLLASIVPLTIHSAAVVIISQLRVLIHRSQDAPHAIAHLLLRLGPLELLIQTFVVLPVLLNACNDLLRVIIELVHLLRVSLDNYQVSIKVVDIGHWIISLHLSLQ